MTDSTETLICSSQNQVTTITINRPRYHNSMNINMWERLANILLELEEDPNTRCIIITGAGEKAFSAGADIQEFQTQRIDSETGRIYNAKVDTVLQTIRTLKTPIIAMINGIAAGGGCEISVACDLRIASTNCKIGIPVAKLGITIGHTEMKSLVELVGLAEQIAELAPLSHAVNKETLNQIYQIPDLNNLNEDQKSLPLNQFDTEDYKEGFNAFLEKRKAHFSGI